MADRDRLVVLTDAQWAALGPLIEACRPRGKTQHHDLRRTIEAIIWRHDNGARRRRRARLRSAWRSWTAPTFGRIKRRRVRPETARHRQSGMTAKHSAARAAASGRRPASWPRRAGGAAAFPPPPR